MNFSDNDNIEAADVADCNERITVVSLAGPTASGKTRLGVEICKRFGGEVVSADSMQIYTGMHIATAKPDEEEMQGIPHHMMNFLPPDCEYSVARYVEDAAHCIKDIHSRSKLPVIVGGTGLYVDSLLNNISFNEQKRDKKYCAELQKICDDRGLDVLLEMLARFDPQSAERLKEGRNPKRIIRAIEFYKTTGTTITRQNELSRRNSSPYKPIKLGLAFKDRAVLYERINRRIDKMLDMGLLNEAKAALGSKLSQTSVKAIGYKELEPYFKGDKSLDECVEKLKTETRRYAKRQITWFKRDKEINLIYADECGSFDEICRRAYDVIERGLMYG